MIGSSSSSRRRRPPDTKDKAKTSRDGAQRAVRNAWSHILYPVKTGTTEAGKAFDLEHLSLTAKDKGAIPAGVYEKARGDGVVWKSSGRTRFGWR
jgi:uncharacterized protein